MSLFGENNILTQLLSLDWISIFITLYRHVKRFIGKRSHEGVYEILEYDSVLELADAKGKNAIYKKRQKVKFLQDNIIAFQDFVWGDGKVLTGYHCSPGVAVDKYRNGDRWNVLISLRETKNSGDIEEFHMQTAMSRSFTKKEEWWQVELQHQTKWLRHVIIFPQERRCQRAVLARKMRKGTLVFGAGHFVNLPDGRQVLTWENKNPTRFETYTIKWRW